MSESTLTGCPWISSLLVKENVEITDAGFYWPDALLNTQPTGQI